MLLVGCCAKFTRGVVHLGFLALSICSLGCMWGVGGDGSIMVATVSYHKCPCFVPLYMLVLCYHERSLILCTIAYLSDFCRKFLLGDFFHGGLYACLIGASLLGDLCLTNHFGLYFLWSLWGHFGLYF